MAVTLKSKMSTQALLPLIRRQVAALDKDLPIYNVQLMTNYVESARKANSIRDLARRVMAGIALLLACTGIYAVTMYSVVQRTERAGHTHRTGAQTSQLLEQSCGKV